mmetsp:Transcript_43156/g.113604  ORF Transcript_43156/g.113604 Transcript_43156/m.113604 type:complete len:160 (-) Transcript_43156:64-543(-)
MLPDEIVQRSTERSRLERPTFYACAASMPEAQVLVPAGLQLWPFKVSGRRHELGRLCGRAQPNAATAVGCSPIACGYVPADDSPGALWENLSQSQNRGAVQPVRLFADGLSKAKVSRKDVHGDCCSDRGSVCSGEGTRDAASPVTKPAQILKSLAYQEL